MPSVYKDRLTSVPTSLNHYISYKISPLRLQQKGKFLLWPPIPVYFGSIATGFFSPFPSKSSSNVGITFAMSSMKNLKGPDLGALKVIWKQLCITEAITHRIIMLLAFTEKVKQHRRAIKFQGCSHPCLLVQYCSREFIERLDF